MKYDLDQSTVQLAQGKLISLPNANGLTVAVLWGSVWLTQDGDRRDYELNGGDSFPIRRDGMVVISAFEHSAIAILQPCEHDAVPSIKPSESAGCARSRSKANDRDGVRYLSGDELERYKRDAHELRAVYVASLIYSLGSVVSRGLTKFGDYAVALWLNGVRKLRRDSRHRLHLS